MVVADVDLGGSVRRPAEDDTPLFRHSRISASPDPLDTVQIEHLVNADDRETSFLRLDRKKPIERISVMKRQSGDSSDVGDLDRQELDARSQKQRGNELAQWLGERQLVEARFDCHLPQARDAERASSVGTLDLGRARALSF
jgi:hypothetical protein